MASSVIASFLEKFNYINLPIRKRKIHEYILGKKNLDDPFFKNSSIRILNELQKENIRGGISVLDRDTSNRISRFNLSKIDDQLKNFQKKNFISFSDLYFQSMKIANTAVCYKQPLNNPKGVVELTVNIHLYNSKDLYKSYKREFSDLKIINLTRNFEDLINSLVSQNFSQKFYVLNKYKFNILRYKRAYLKYLDAIKDFEGLNIEFNDIFEPYNQNTLNNICEFIDEKKIHIDKLKKDKFDLYGKLTNYNKAFNIFDNNINFIPNLSKKFIRSYFKKRNSFFKDIYTVLTFQIIYIFSLFKFRSKVHEYIKKNKK